MPIAFAPIPQDYLEALQPAIEKIIKKLYHEGKRGDELFQLTGETLAKQVSDSFKSVSISNTTPDVEMLARITRDVWQFSAAKNYQQMRDITLALKDSKGNLREFADFKESASKICEKYNETWLRTEYDMSIAASQNAARWVEFEKEAQTIPYLRYQTVGDSSVRDSHALLNGVVRKISDSFWNSHYPPNGWGCRCEVVQELNPKAETPVQNIPHVGIPAMFRTNLAKTGLIYPKNHPYYNGVPKAELLKSIAYLPPESTYMDVVMGDHEIQIHPLHGSGELAENLNITNLLLKHDPEAKIKLLPSINFEEKTKEKDIAARIKFFGKKYQYQFEKTNPDAMYNGRIVEYKSPNGSKSSIQNAIEYGRDQSKWVILRVSDNANMNEIKGAANGKLKHYKDDKEDYEVWIINSKEKLVFHTNNKRQ